MTPPPVTEILVHIAAASRASDDVRYRALAQAYADFERAGRIDVAVRHDYGGRSSGVAADGRSLPAEQASIVHQKKSETTSFASLSFESVWDNVQSPGLWPPAVTMRPVPSKLQPLEPELQHYVSPDDYIPDSQPDNINRVRRRPRVSTSFDESRIIESPRTSGSFASAVDETTSRCIRRAASPDLSAMPVDKIDDTFGSFGSFDSFGGMDSFGNFNDPLQSQRQPLAQRSANTTQSSQNEAVAADDVPIKGSPPLYDDDNDDGDVVPSSPFVPSPGLRNRLPATYTDIPSSLPEESGRVVIRVEASSYEQRRGLLDSVPSSSTATASATASATATATATRRRGSDAGQPLPKRQCLATAAVVEGAANTQDNGDTGAADADTDVDTDTDTDIDADTDTDALSGNDLHVFRTLPRTFPSSSPTASAPGLYHDQSLRIISPEPPVACARLDAASLITDKMAKLARDLDITRRYRPAAPPSGEQGVRSFERGCWRLRTSGWPAALRQQAWDFLASYVGAGDAGWSVWCSRDPAPHTWLRLHCFAATAGHTYLVLYLASQRQILTTGAEWLDGAGSPMITVPPRRKRQQLW
ncbi:MAG: hypothetical protein STHCBS139747_001187 [Sporothrix thermara]